MKSPITGKEMILKREHRKMTFRKEEFEIFYHFYLCEDSGETFEDEALMQLNLTQVHNQYRAKYHLPFREEIVVMRNRYVLSATKMSAILGFGTNVWRNYENGEIPNVSNGRLIQLIKDPEEFYKLLKISRVLSEKDMGKAKQQLEKVSEKRRRLQERDAQRFLLGTAAPNPLTGFRVPNLDKFCQMVRYFVEQSSPWKVKLNKLLFYADFLHFRRTGFGISGASYVAIKMGPVPKNFDGLFGEALQEDFLTIEIKHFENGGSGELYRPGSQRFEPEIFSPNELETMKMVAEKFHTTNTKAMIDLSHQEKAWKERIEGHRPIEYWYAFDLKGV